MAVVVIAERFPPAPGGLARATRRIAQTLAALGESVDVVTSESRVAAGDCRSTPDGATTLHLVGRTDDAVEHRLAMIHHATEIARRTSADVVVGIWALDASLVAIHVAAATGARSVVSIRGNDLDRGSVDDGRMAVLAEVMRAADRVLAVSQDHATRAQRLHRREVTHLTNSVDGDAFRPMARDQSLRRVIGLGDSTVIGFSGELREKKGIRFLLPAFASLARRRDVRLLLIGGAREDSAPALHAFLQGAPDVADRVHVIPWDERPEHLSRVMALVDAMVFPSILEGTPNAVLEAMACARPVLASDVGGHRDLITHNETGALFPLAVLDQLPDVIEEFLDHPSRERFGKAARAHVLQRHNRETEMAAWAEVLDVERAASRRP